MTYQEKVMIALSCYATYKPYTITEWFKIKEEVKNDKHIRSAKADGLLRRVG